eukprot:gene6932-4657_t
MPNQIDAPWVTLRVGLLKSQDGQEGQLTLSGGGVAKGWRSQYEMVDAPFVQCRVAFKTGEDAFVKRVAAKAKQAVHAVFGEGGPEDRISDTETLRAHLDAYDGKKQMFIYVLLSKASA